MTPAPPPAPQALAAGLSDLLLAQRQTLETGVTLPIAFRRERLRALQAALTAHERRLLDALRADLGKCDVEGFGTELGIVRGELRHTLAHLRAWMRPTRAPVPLLLQPAKARVLPTPIGTNLIIAPWNYPVNLALAPVIAALAAGNVAVLKPSELAPATADALKDLINGSFDRAYFHCVTGGPEVASALVDLPFDHVFFTGSTRIGRVVAQAAAARLARVTLELGGKSPAIVMPSADLATAARRIAWGKTTNAGQTCVAPDYLVVHEQVKAQVVDGIRAAWRQFYGDEPRRSPDYGRIINAHHTRRLAGLIERRHVIHGGEVDVEERYIAPTLLDGVGPDDAVMQEEIFGPILPILTVRSLAEALEAVRRHPNPLALYLFTRDSGDERSVMEGVPFGGGCINTTMMHLGVPELPFGGVGASGLGAYHGKAGFDAFTHYKSVLDAATWADPALRYPPYAGRFALVKGMMR